MAVLLRDDLAVDHVHRSPSAGSGIRHTATIREHSRLGVIPGWRWGARRRACVPTRTTLLRVPSRVSIKDVLWQHEVVAARLTGEVGHAPRSVPINQPNTEERAPAGLGAQHTTRLRRDLEVCRRRGVRQSIFEGDVPTRVQREDRLVVAPHPEELSLGDIFSD